MPDETLIERMAEAIERAESSAAPLPVGHEWYFMLARAAYEELPLGVEAFWDGHRFYRWLNPFTKTWEPFTETMMADYARAGTRQPA